MLLLQFGYTPLDLAHKHDHCQVVEYLLSKGAKVNRCNKVSMYTYVTTYVCVMEVLICSCCEIM